MLFEPRLPRLAAGEAGLTHCGRGSRRRPSTLSLIGTRLQYFAQVRLSPIRRNGRTYSARRPQDNHPLFGPNVLMCSLN
jgi:hypothetical protein